MDSIRKNASNELEMKTRNYMRTHRVDYRTAFYAIKKADPQLFQRYSFGADATVVKSYNADTLTPAQRAMANLLADAGKVQTLAGFVVDKLAHQRIRNVGPGVADPVEAYRRAVSDVKKEYPSLARAAQDGFIDQNDFKLLALLVPSIAGEIERGNYSRSGSSTQVRKYSADNHIALDSAGREYRTYSFAR